jgi:hypothetical protein
VSSLAGSSVGSAAGATPLRRTRAASVGRGGSTAVGHVLLAGVCLEWQQADTLAVAAAVAANVVVAGVAGVVADTLAAAVVAAVEAAEFRLTQTRAESAGPESPIQGCL